MILNNGFDKCSLFVLSANGWKDQKGSLRFPDKENPNMEKALFDWAIVLQYDFSAKYLLISRKVSGIKFFHLNVRLTNESHAGLYPFDKSIKSLYFRLFVVSVLCARFHFKVIRQSL